MNLTRNRRTKWLSERVQDTTLKGTTMPAITIPLERVVFGNEHWRSNRAIDEIEVYCDLLDCLQERIEALHTRGKDEEVTLTNVKSMISSYAFEIGLKSLWALDNPADKVTTTHDLLELFGELSEGTVESLNRLPHDQKSICELAQTLR